MLDEIAAADADVLVIQEYSPLWHEAFVAAGIPEAYPHSVLLVRDDPFGSAIYSRRPITDGGEWKTGGLPMIRATIMLDDRPVRLYNIHPFPPTGSAGRWNPQMAAMVAALQAETGPAIAIGDFNMNRHVRHYRDLLKSGFHSAHVETGRGFVTTWPNGMLRYVPPVQLDHALFSEELVALHTEEGVGQGSDHIPFIVDVAWR